MRTPRWCSSRASRLARRDGQPLTPRVGQLNVVSDAREVSRKPTARPALGPDGGSSHSMSSRVKGMWNATPGGLMTDSPEKRPRRARAAQRCRHSRTAPARWTALCRSAPAPAAPPAEPRPGPGHWRLARRPGDGGSPAQDSLRGMRSSEVGAPAVSRRSRAPQGPEPCAQSRHSAEFRKRELPGRAGDSLRSWRCPGC